MKGFGKQGSGRKGFKKQGKGDSGGFRGRDSGGSMGKPRRETMNEVTCDECGEKCLVPFRPTGNKPVYCSKCFRNKRDSAPAGKIDSYAREFEQINRKMDKIMKALNIE
ncbi:MAG: hypothetical protein KKE96_04205 [Candidatus Altiarchaeota archaeon]|nr:hypothetical protein [Candidatus Altiarchaeota archaeon]